MLEMSKYYLIILFRFQEAFDGFLAFIQSRRVYDVSADSLLFYCYCYFYRANRSHVDQLAREIPEFLERGDYAGLKALLEKDGGIPASVVLAGVEHMNLKVDQTSLIEGAASHAAGLLKNYLNYLDVIVTLSPLMGLLGTVIGMIGSFNVLSVSNGQPFAVTGGVAEALVCTATGLFVAIIALIAYTYLSQQVSNFVSQMEKLGTLYLAIVEAKTE